MTDKQLFSRIESELDYSLDELEKAVLAQMCFDSWDDFLETVAYFQSADQGVHGFIYYVETADFYNKHQDLIIESLDHYVRDTGFQFEAKKLLDKNWLSWFALENTLFNLQNQLPF